MVLTVSPENRNTNMNVKSVCGKFYSVWDRNILLSTRQSKNWIWLSPALQRAYEITKAMIILETQTHLISLLTFNVTLVLSLVTWYASWVTLFSSGGEVGHGLGLVTGPVQQQRGPMLARSCGLEGDGFPHSNIVLTEHHRKLEKQQSDASSRSHSFHNTHGHWSWSQWWSVETDLALDTSHPGPILKVMKDYVIEGVLDIFIHVKNDFYVFITI